MRRGAETDDLNPSHLDPWARLLGLMVLALLLTAAVAYRELDLSSRHGRLSVPPLYDDVSYFLDAIRWRDGLSSRTLAGNVLSVLHRHAPFSSLVAAIGFHLVPHSYVGPYLVNTVFVFAFLLGIIGLTWTRPLHQVATCLIISACVPVIWHTVGEARPDLPWGLALGIAIGAIARRGLLQRGRWALLLLGAGCGLAVSIKPTAFPASLALLGSTVTLRVFLDCVLAGGLRPTYVKAVASLLCFAAGLLVVAALLIGPSLVSTITYIINVFVTQRDLWTSNESFWAGLQYFLVGSGGKAGLNFWLWVGLGLMVLRLLLAARSGRPALFDAIALLAALVISYAIPSVQEIKTYFFGAIFYGIFIVAIALNFCACQDRIESWVAKGPVELSRRRHLRTGIRVLPLVAVALLFAKSVGTGQINLATPVGMQQQEDIRVATDRVWALAREARGNAAGRRSIGFSNAYPVTPATIELFAARAHMSIDVRPELFHRTLEETERALLQANIIVITSSMPHTLVGPRVGDDLILRMDANKNVCLLEALNFPDVRMRVYRNPC